MTPSDKGFKMEKNRSNSSAAEVLLMLGTRSAGDFWVLPQALKPEKGAMDTLP